ncbi:MAG: helix-turn-helix transcriptional regulator [Solobacterium sp.]|nr:helix-turn-helix transcriptional regulator [Solobacterium sp.]
MNKQSDALNLLLAILDDKQIGFHEITLPLKRMKDVPDMGLRAMLYGETTAMNERFPSALKKGEVPRVYLISDTFLCHYFLFPMTGKKSFGLVGPYQSSQLSYAQMKDIRDYHQLSPAMFSAFQQYCSTVPTVGDSALFESVLRTFCIACYGKENFQFLPWRAEIIHPQKTIRQDVKPVFQELESRYANEAVLMTSIAEGDYEKAAAAMSALSVYGMESRSASLFRDMKNYSIILNTICRVSASRGGAHPQQVDSLSRSFFFRIEQAVDQNELLRLTDEMIHSYCDAVSRQDSSVKSLQVKRAIAYISSHFHEPVTLSETVAELGITKTYLSALFRKETGESFTEYVSRYRCSIGADLLRSSRLSIDEIAFHCGLSDTNYFSRIFKKHYGVSPRNYRQKWQSPAH